MPTPDTNIVNQGANLGAAAGGTAKSPAALGSRERYRSEFLADRSNVDTEDRVYSSSMQGLRAAEASKGLLYASGKYWREGDDGKFVEISKKDYKAIKNSNQHAQDFARDKIEDAKLTIVKGDNENNDTDGYSVDDAVSGGYTQAQAEAIGSGGYVETEIGGSEADQPEQSAVSPADTANSKKSARMQSLQEKKDNGELDYYISGKKSLS